MNPTSYALLALSFHWPRIVEAAHGFLLRARNSNGSWPVFLGDDQDGSGVTSLVAIALRELVPAIPARLNFNPDKYGWPWGPIRSAGWCPPASRFCP
jgi:hypothetical protein